MSSASANFLACQPKKYDVFISFRGSDIRSGFLSHIDRALRGEGIYTFLDEKLEKGKEVSKSLLPKIEQSALSLVIISPNYASSEWCLDELVTIMKCKKRMKQMVVPVFYDVEPSDVENLNGSFGEAMAKHREEFKNSLHRVAFWNDALKEIGGTAGLVSQKIKPEAKLFDQIVVTIMKKLDKRAEQCYYICGYGDPMYPPFLPPPPMDIPPYTSSACMGYKSYPPPPEPYPLPPYKSPPSWSFGPPPPPPPPPHLPPPPPYMGRSPYMMDDMGFRFMH